MFEETRDLVRAKLETRPDEGSSKVMPMAEALRRFVRPGMRVHMGSVPGRPVAATWELIRQFRGQRPEFEFVIGGFNSLFGGSPLIRAGLVRKVVCAFAGATYPSPAPSKIFQAAFADKLVEFEHWTLVTLALRLKAAAMGVPFATTRSLIGSSMERTNAHAFQVIDDPFHSGERVGALQALYPDLSIIHGLAADRNGNTLLAPPLGDNSWGAMAAREGAIVTVERIVSSDVIRRNNHFGRLPGYFVRSVSEVPFGAHPTGVNNQWIAGIDGYAEDYEFLIETRKADRTVEDLDAWMEKWVYSVKDHQEYLDKVGFQRLLFLRGKAQWDSYGQEMESLKEQIELGPQYNSIEHMVAVASRLIGERVVRNGHKTVLAGVGASNLSAWLACSELKAQDVDVELMAEIGFFGYTPRPGDPFIFNHRNIPTCKALADVEHILGIFAEGSQNRCLGSLGAAQLDKFGNINSTFIPPKLLLVGSGGGNDIASGCREIVITAVQSRSRFLEEVPFITSPGRAVSTLVSNLGVFEKLGEDKELSLTGYLLRPGLSEEEAVRNIKEQCGWELKVAPALRRHEGPSMEELRMMRLFDPHRQFLNE